MTRQQCGTCGGDVHDVGALCSICTGRLRRHLLDIPALLAELDTTALRQAKTGDGQGSGNGIPWNEKAREAQAAIRAAVTRWYRVRAAQALGQGHDAATFPVITRWLADQTGRIRLHDWAPAMHADIRTVMGAGWRAIDRPEDRWYAGPCGGQCPTPQGIQECTWTLWARLDQVAIVCPQCDTSWRVDARREWLMAAADDVWETAPNIASALTIMLRTRVSPATIRYWAATNQLAPVGERGTARLYRVGDVIALIHRRDQPPPTQRDTPDVTPQLTSR